LRKFNLKKTVITIIVVFFFFRLLLIMNIAKGVNEASFNMSITLHTNNKVRLELEYVNIKTHPFREIRGIYNVSLGLNVTENYSSIKVLANFYIRGLEFLPTIFRIEAVYSGNKGNILFEFLGPLTSKAQAFICRVNDYYNILIVGDSFLLHFMPSKENLIHTLESLGLFVEEFTEEFTEREFKIFIKARTVGNNEVSIKYCKIDVIRGRIILEGNIECEVSFEKNLWSKINDSITLYLEKMNYTEIHDAYAILTDNVALGECSMLISYARILKTNSTTDIVKVENISLKSTYKENIDGTKHILKTISNIYRNFKNFGVNKTIITIIEGDSEVSVSSENLLAKPYKVEYLPDGRKVLTFNSSEVLLRLDKAVSNKTVQSLRMYCILLFIIALLVLIILFRHRYYGIRS